MSTACPAAHSSSTVLPMPASPRSTSAPLSPSRTAASTPSSAAVSGARSSNSLIAQSSRRGRDGPAASGRPSPQGGARPSSLTCHQGTSRSQPPKARLESVVNAGGCFGRDRRACARVVAQQFHPWRRQIGREPDDADGHHCASFVTGGVHHGPFSKDRCSERAVVLRPPADLGLRGLSGGLDEGQHVLWVGDHRDVVRRHLDGGGAHAGGELALGFGRDGLIAGGDEEPRRP